MFKFGYETWTLGKENDVERLESQKNEFMRHLWVPQG
jgi:hypothetical protein